VLQIPNFNPYALGPYGPFHLFGMNVGPVGIRWYALAYITGIVLGWLYAARLIKTERLWGERGAPIQTRQLDDLVLWLTMGIILGGRFGYVLFYGSSQPEFWEHPLNILKIWDGGMSFHGGLLGVALALILYAWRGLNGSWSGAAFRDTFRLSAPHSVWRVGDVIAPVAPVGLFFGRIANFINGELWGRPTNLPWGVIFCNDNIRATHQGACPEGARHPSQLYEAGLEGLVLFAILAFGAYKLGWLKRPGIATGVFLVGYGLSRLALENVREPDEFMPPALQGWITMGMILCIPMILGGIWLIWAARKQPAEA
jgi:phosphatidylglycerol:prolipoprotein diacylglycerol transferase